MTEIEVRPEHTADPNSRRVGILVGVVGILLSVVTIASHRAHTKAVIYRPNRTTSGAYYQAKKIRENTTEMAATVLQELAADPAKAAASVRKLERARKKYADDAGKIMKEAKAKDAETEARRGAGAALRHRRGVARDRAWCSARLYFLARKSFFPVFGMLAEPGRHRSWESGDCCFDEARRRLRRLRRLRVRRGSRGPGVRGRRGRAGARRGPLGAFARRRHGAGDTHEHARQPAARQRAGRATPW